MIMQSRTDTATKAYPLLYSKTERWLLAHDIRNLKRLSRVYRLLNKEGLRLQFSVYVIACTREKLENILEKLRELINSDEDDIRIYALTSQTKMWGLGAQFDQEVSSLVDAVMINMLQSPADDTAVTAESSGLLVNNTHIATDDSKCHRHKEGV